MNARGIPTATYQKFHLLSYPGGRYAISGWRVPIPGQEIPHLWMGCTPSLDGRVSPSWGTPILTWQGVPHPWMGNTLSWGTTLFWPGTSHWDTPPLKGHETSDSSMGWRWEFPSRKHMGSVEVLCDADGDGVPPPPPRCEQTENITSRLVLW